MQLSDFAIGEDFMTAIGQWRCTDIGLRTISAIRWPDQEYDPIEYAQRKLWLQGPPYMIPEEVFDEKAMALAYRSLEEAVRQRPEDRLHPGFASEDAKRMMAFKRERGVAILQGQAPSEHYRSGLLRHDRVKDKEVLHAYDWREEADGVFIQTLDIFQRIWADIPICEWLGLPLSTHQDLAAASQRQKQRRKNGE